jgi:23S rRNA pseudouridine2604 synthase
MRINKYLSTNGVCSRREADRLIESGQVLINKKVATLGDQVTEEDYVFVKGKAVLKQEERIYIAYHKPVGIEVTQNKEIKHNLANELGFDTHLFPIGRLDKDSSGLLLMTNDGDIVNKVLRPQFLHEKEYLVHVDKAMTEIFLKRLSEGVKLKKKRTRTARVERHNKRAFKMILTEGKNRQIRRMCEAFGYTVTALKRIRIMNINIGHLKVGAWRHLKPAERKQFLDTLS